jgi:transcriptional regulator with XRE-family HTH domain
MLRRERDWSQEKLGRRSGLSGKFIGEVERGEKSISIDSLYRVSRALAVPLRELTDVNPRRASAPNAGVEKVLGLLARHRKPDDVRKAYDVLRAIFGEDRGGR